MTDLVPTSRYPQSLTALLLASAALALAACGDKGGNETAGQKLDSAVARTEQAGADAKAKADQMATDAKAKAESSTASAESKLKEAGAAAVASVDDAAITAAVSAGLAKDPDLSAIKIDVDTKGGTVSLTGPAPNPAAKERAEQIAKAVKGVNAVDNKLEVKAM
jgi:hyperosmotically inducible protein